MAPLLSLSSSSPSPDTLRAALLGFIEEHEARLRSVVRKHERELIRLRRTSHDESAWRSRAEEEARTNESLRRQLDERDAELAHTAERLREAVSRGKGRSGRRASDDDLNDLQAKADKYKRRINELEEEIERMEDERRERRREERRRNAEAADGGAAQEELERLKAALGKAEKRRDEDEAELDRLHRAVKAGQERPDPAELSAARAELQRKEEAMRERSAEWEKEVAEWKKEMTQLTADLDQKDDAIERLTQRLATAQQATQAQALTHRVEEDLRAEVEVAREEGVKEKEKGRRLERTVAQLQAESVELKEELVQGKASVDEWKALAQDGQVRSAEQEEQRLQREKDRTKAVQAELTAERQRLLDIEAARERELSGMEALKQRWSEDLAKVTAEAARKEEEAERLREEVAYNATVMGRMRDELGQLQADREAEEARVRRVVDEETKEKRLEEERMVEQLQLEKARWQHAVGEAEEERERWKKAAEHAKEKLTMLQRERDNQHSQTLQDADDDAHAAARLKKAQHDVDGLRHDLAAKEDERAALQRRLNALLVGRSDEERRDWLDREQWAERSAVLHDLTQRLERGSRERKELEAIIECQGWTVETLVLAQEEDARRRAERKAKYSLPPSPAAKSKAPARRDEEKEPDNLAAPPTDGPRVRQRPDQKRHSFQSVHALRVGTYSEQDDRQAVSHYDQIFVDTPAALVEVEILSPLSPKSPAAAKAKAHARLSSETPQTVSTGGEEKVLTATTGAHNRSASAVGSYARPTASSRVREEKIATRKAMIFGSTAPISPVHEHKTREDDSTGSLSFFS